MIQAETSVFHGGGDVGARMRAHDWRRTPLGPVAGWPASLKTLVGVMLGAKQPMFSVWGPELTLLYNDAYRAILGHKDHDALGRSFLDVWREARTDLAPLVAKAFSGEPVHMDDITLIVDREGLAPEAHFAFSYTPVRDDEGDVRGFFCACNETTEYVLAGRRQAFRLELDETLRGLDEADAMIDATVEALRTFLEASRVGFAEVQPDESRLLVTSSGRDGVAPPSGMSDLASFGEGFVAPQRHGRTIVSTDVAGDPAYDAAIWAGLGARAVVSVPTLRAGRLRSMLFVHQAEPRRWSRDDVVLIESVALRVGDAVERVRAETEARASEERFRTLTQAIPNQVWTATPVGTIDWVNDRAQDYSGEVATVDGGLDWTSIVHPDDLPAVGVRWASSLGSGEVYETEFRIRRADGAYRWHLVRAVPQRDFKGAVTRWVGTNTDIDDQKRAELDLSAAKLAAEEANLAKSTFIANMSHELRTPLSAIIGYSEMMLEEIEDGTDAAGLGADMRKIEGNARHLLGLINDVLDLSKVESGKMEVFAEDFEVEPMLREVATAVGSLVAKKSNTLELRLAPGLGAMHSDMTKMRQVLLNLLGNSAKFTEAGTITLSASRETGEDGIDRLKLGVADTGIGMTAEQLNKLFQRFQQADSSTTRKFGGTGLGLSLTKAFADILGGTVSVESASGEGSVFTLTLPATYVPVNLDEPSPEADSTGPAGGAGEGSGQDLVLVIDDDADQRTLMTRFLGREGFRVQVAADGKTGLELARKLHPRAILLDVMMPGIDGWSVLSELKADPDLSDTPVVMVTGVDERSLAASLGASDYMLKPVRWDRFSQVMDRFRTPEGGILLVEDDAAARLHLRAVLEKDGWSVAEAGDGREGLRQATAHRPEVVLLDLNMPVMDGFDFLKELRELPGCADLPVVVLTAQDLTRDDRRRLRGASQILNKGDISLRSLVERLHGLSGAAQARAAT